MFSWHYLAQNRTSQDGSFLLAAGKLARFFDKVISAGYNYGVHNPSDG